MAARIVLWCCIFASAAPSQVRELSALGKKLFFDPSISASGKVACSSCHDPRAAYAPLNSLPVQLGGADGRQRGFRAAPSLRYLQVVPWFSEHYFDYDGPDESIDNGVTGGLTWDGRFDRVRDQARVPLLSAFEMANESPDAVVAKVKKTPYAAEFERLASRSGEPFATILEALEVWQQEDREFYPYSSKFDAFLAGRTQLSAQERRGLALFSDAAKGNCARCHTVTRGANGTPPQLTDWGYAALGAPRNRQIPANSDPAWYDLGLCGPAREDLRGIARYCGEFRTPSLRNVALRGAFFHNGVFHSLREAVEFYAQRDTNPAKWYPREKFDDLPAQYRGNVEMGAPFGRAAGMKPALDDSEIAAIVAFLETLNDGFSPPQHPPDAAGKRSVGLPPGNRR